jgi:hypothetical protein
MDEKYPLQGRVEGHEIKEMAFVYVPTANPFQFLLYKSISPCSVGWLQGRAEKRQAPRNVSTENGFWPYLQG